MSIYAVNGKEPIAAWIPSRDTVGNGTTTLTDLVGSNNGTLTNMDPATDWVADTGAGGVRALDFDGEDDYVDTPYTVDSGVHSVAYWVNFNELSGSQITGVNMFDKRFYLGVNGDRVYAGFGTAFNNTATSGLSTGWGHLAMTGDGSTARVYVNAVEKASFSYSYSASTSPFLIGKLVNGFLISGRIDDIRIWDVALAAADVTALYAGGLGRGITFGGTIQTRRRRDQRNQYGGGL